MALLRRFPAALWVLVYVASLLILNGSHGKMDPVQLSLGIGLVLISCGLGLYLAFAPWPDGTPRPTTAYWFIGGVIAFYVVCATAAFILAGTAEGIATLLAGGIPLTAVALWAASARSGAARRRGRMVEATADDSDDPIPALGADEERPLGDTPEVHDEITPHDLPPDHPGRKAAERQAGDLGGTTRGHEEGGAAPLSEESEDRLMDPRFEKDGAKLRPR